MAGVQVLLLVAPASFHGLPLKHQRLPLLQNGTTKPILTCALQQRFPPFTGHVNIQQLHHVYTLREHPEACTRSSAPSFCDHMKIWRYRQTALKQYWCTCNSDTNSQWQEQCCEHLRLRSLTSSATRLPAQAAVPVARLALLHCESAGVSRSRCIISTY
eukprot:129613-Pelagomonas_calceolata.AAC.1